MIKIIAFVLCTFIWAASAADMKTTTAKSKPLPAYCYTNRDHPCWADAHPSNGQLGKAVTANFGEGCNISMKLLNGEVSRLGGDPSLKLGGLRVEPIPKSWKSSLDALYFGLNCHDKDDPMVSQSVPARFDESQKKWVKDMHVAEEALRATTDKGDADHLRDTIRTTHVWNVDSVNAQGWALTGDDLIGDERWRKKGMSFCLFHRSKAICGLGDVAYLQDGPKGDLTKRALEIIKSIEFLDDAPPVPRSPVASEPHQ